MVREDFLQQNAFMDVDSFSDYERQKKLLGMILSYDVLCRDAIAKGASAQELFQIPAREQIGRAKSVPAEEYAAVYDQIQSVMEQRSLPGSQRRGRRMIREYKTVEEISGPLMMVRMVENVTYDETGGDRAA